MKVVILAGGFGTRISEESEYKPKPMIEIGGQPILWHIMKTYAYYGFNEFIICCGYKANVIKEYFANYFWYHSDMTFDFRNGNSIEVHDTNVEPWKVTVVDTGLHTMTGGRLKRIAPYIGNETFMLTYGDGVCDVNIKNLVEYHKKHKKMVTLTAVQPSSRFGTLDFEKDNMVKIFAEKKEEAAGWINGGYMVMQPEIFQAIRDDSTVLEREPLEYAAKEGQLIAFKHTGFWQCMDTLRDKKSLETLIQNKNAPWMVWEEKEADGLL